jgi:hypothetical protein
VTDRTARRRSVARIGSRSTVSSTITGAPALGLDAVALIRRIMTEE